MDFDPAASAGRRPHRCRSRRCFGLSEELCRWVLLELMRLHPRTGKARLGSAAALISGCQLLCLTLTPPCACLLPPCPAPAFTRSHCAADDADNEQQVALNFARAAGMGIAMQFDLMLTPCASLEACILQQPHFPTLNQSFPQIASQLLSRGNSSAYVQLQLMPFGRIVVSGVPGLKHIFLHGEHCAAGQGKREGKG